MLSDSDVALARIADLAYMDGSTTLPPGFFEVSQAELGISTGPNESYANGLYTNFNAAAEILVGTVNGVTTAILDFRGSVNRQDSLNDLQDINRQYPLYANIIAAFDAWVARESIGNVLVTGHSLGGAMDQIYMGAHANNATTSYTAETFGSPGIITSPATDNRITNIQIADDPAVYLGENRATVGAELQSNPALAAAAIFEGPQVFPGLTYLDVIDSIGDLNTNYVNRGAVVQLPDADGTYTGISNLLGAASAGLNEHLVTTYISRLEALTGDSGNNQIVPGITPTTTGIQVYRFFNETNGTHFYTASAAESTEIQANDPAYVYEGVGLNAVKPTDPNATPVYRFFVTTNGTHFYTDSSTEVATIEATLPNYTYEGVAFDEHATPQPGDSPVYRFFDTTDGTHFYTASSAERSSVLAASPNLVNEGIAFYTLSS
jgi:hypothetical protein